jgi:trk system potassium uptake protein TrkH
MTCGAWAGMQPSRPRNPRRVATPFLQPVAYVVGMVLTVIGVLMLIPAAVDFVIDNPDWKVFAASSALTVFVGMALVLANRSRDLVISRRQGFVLTTALWLFGATACALPLMLSEPGLSFTDGFFEAMAGLTTTGSTVITGLDTLPPGILLWRGLIQGVGGVGFIVVGLAMLPFLRVGGMQLFRMESSEKEEEKPLPQARRFALALLLVYLLLVGSCAILLDLAGMSHLEAAVHSFTAVSTGGFSTSDASVGHFDSPAIHWICVVYMTAGSLPLLLFVQALQRKPMPLLRDVQVRSFLMFLGATIAIVASWLVIDRGFGVFEAMTLAAFNVTSVISTTGFATADYTQWGPLPLMIFFFLMFAGGCTGSTAGGLKMFRFNLFILALRAYVKRLIFPHARVAATFNGRPVTDDVVSGVLLFVMLYLLTTAIAALLLAAMGLDLVTSISGAVTAIGNVGPGLGDIIGPAGNFKSLPDGAKWVLSITMMLGRLELFTALTLLTPGFWRD